ncbi:MAG: bifunctional alpha,alpha-trehalose-phosphate synthase (UDP-forming)/trehalose-phosphatase [Planctomycetota bacterium]
MNSRSNSPQRQLVVASNRLPISLGARDSEAGFELRRSSGGLAAALAGVAEDQPFDWVGWPGCFVPIESESAVRESLAEQRLFPLFLSEEEERGFYRGYSNGAIWPLFHYFADRAIHRESDWASYVAVNRRFAAAIAELAAEEARVWIHDFHLMLVPSMLRELREDLKIAFFLHVPWPSSEIYRILPSREELLRGLLGADLVAFHTFDYARHFRSTSVRVLGASVTHDAVQFEGHRTTVAVHPIGIDVAGFRAALTDADAGTRLAELRHSYGGHRMILGVERLDYTKGIAHKLRAFERLLERRGDLVGRVTLLQVIVPSRLQNSDYAELKGELEEMVGRINGRFAMPGFTPVEYVHRSFDAQQLAMLYRYASACMVTPVRDGMNLVAQEFVFCQQSQQGLDEAHRGMLVLSEFAGAAQVLSRAILVNPWDTEGLATALEQALDMSPAERVERMATMAAKVTELDCRHWARAVLADLARVTEHTGHAAGQAIDAGTEQILRASWAAADHRLVLLDYDGTLREIVRTPEAAAPDEAIRTLLRALAQDPRNEVHVVSGRHRADLDRWLSGLGVHLCAEHGFASRRADATQWQELENLDLGWIPTVVEILQSVCEEVPGTRVEQKPCAVAWHYRLADADYGPWRARELLNELESRLARLPVDIVHGNRVIEVRPSGVHKGVYATAALAIAEQRGHVDFIFCAGDDTTDRDMFRSLPPSAITVHVGEGDEHARWRIASPARLRRLLGALVDPRGNPN